MTVVNTISDNEAASVLPQHHRYQHAVRDYPYWYIHIYDVIGIESGRLLWNYRRAYTLFLNCNMNHSVNMDLILHAL